MKGIFANEYTHGGVSMYSRCLEEQLLIQRLIKVNQTNREKADKKRTVSVYLDEAVQFYMQNVVSTYAVSPVTEMPQEKREIKADFQRMNIQEVLEVSKVLRRRKEEQENKYPENSAKQQEKEENMDTTENSAATTAYECLDCSQRDNYLLYSYNCFGRHSMIGRDIKPGSYGGRITTGDFVVKA